MGFAVRPAGIMPTFPKMVLVEDKLPSRFFLFFVFVFFFFFKILFLYFRKGKEGREGEKHQCVVDSHMPHMEDVVHNPGMCPHCESNQ